MAAWNRWCASIVLDSAGHLAPVAHLTLRDRPWALTQLGQLERAGVRLAMIAPALIDGRPLSHRDHDELWRAFVEHGVTVLRPGQAQQILFEGGGEERIHVALVNLTLG